MGSERKQKVLLLSTNQAVTPYPVPPLGLACLYQELKSRYEVRIIDGLELSRDQVVQHLISFKPDYVGISIRNIDDMVKGDVHSFLPMVVEEFIIPVRRHHQEVLILGGSGFSIFPDELMELSGADYGVVGEAEETFIHLLECLEEGKDPGKLPGVVGKGIKLSRNEVRKCYSLDRPFDAQLDRLLDYAPYRERGAYPIQSKRGCVHQCIYCSYPVLEGRRYRRRKVEHIADEIKAAAERLGHGVTFEFVDSTFNDPPGHAEAICREIIGRGINVSLRTMGINPANVTDELLILMKEAGFSQIDSTPDSASPSVLKKMGKNFSLAQLRQSARIIAEHNMPTMWFFIFGGPGETRRTVAETFDFIDQYIDQDDMVHVTEGLRIYPHTPLYRMALQENFISADESLLSPKFYVSPLVGEETLRRIIDEQIALRSNCIRISETKPPPELMAAAMKERAEKKLDEPLFRTLLRLKRQMGL